MGASRRRRIDDDGDQMRVPRAVTVVTPDNASGHFGYLREVASRLRSTGALDGDLLWSADRLRSNPPGGDSAVVVSSVASIPELTSVLRACRQGLVTGHASVLIVLETPAYGSAARQNEQGWTLKAFAGWHKAQGSLLLPDGFNLVMLVPRLGVVLAGRGSAMWLPTTGAGMVDEKRTSWYPADVARLVGMLCHTTTPSDLHQRMRIHLYGAKPDLETVLRLQPTRVTDRWLRATTGGCFDRLHDGHRAFLSGCMKLCERLTVLINTDTDARRLKGSERPFDSFDVRVTALRSLLRSADRILPFDIHDAIAKVSDSRPEAYLKGRDYWNAPLMEVATLGAVPVLLVDSIIEEHTSERNVIS